MGLNWKRPLNVDMLCNLRVMGFSKESYHFTSDEGDGYEVYAMYQEGEGPELKQHHFEEWAEQLKYAAEWCSNEALKLKKGSESELPKKDVDS